MGCIFSAWLITWLNETFCLSGVKNIVVKKFLNPNQSTFLAHQYEFTCTFFYFLRNHKHVRFLCKGLFTSVFIHHALFQHSILLSHFFFSSCLSCNLSCSSLIHAASIHERHSHTAYGLRTVSGL